MLERGKRNLIILFLAPALLLYSIFFIWPAAQSIYLSLFDWNGVGEPKFIGIANFQELLQPGDVLFWPSLGNTLVNVFLGGLLTFGLAFVLTACLSGGIRGKKFFRLIIFAPNAVPAIALALLWAQVYNPRYGLLKNFFSGLGLEDLAQTAWLGPDHVLLATLIAMCWIWVGFNLVMLLAAVEQIPQDMFDAANLDGANIFQVFQNITIPLIWEVLTIAMINFSVIAFKIFEFPFIIKGLQAPNEVYTLAIYNYVLAFGRREPIWRLGKAAAVAVLMQIIVIILILVFSRLFKRDPVQYS